MLTRGISLLLLTFFYFVTDYWGFKSWSYYFCVIGMNSIFVYLFTRMVDLVNLSPYFTGWLIKPITEDFGKIAVIISGLALVWLLLNNMFRKKIFLRV